MKLVVRIGGSIVASPINADLISKYVSLFQEFKRMGYDVAVVVGGGSLARTLIEAAKNLGLSEECQDKVAISVSRVIAELFFHKLGFSGCEKASISVDDVVRCQRQGRIPVIGGLRPGMTTDTVAALIAKQTEADLYVKATDQDGIYDRDPRKHPGSKKLDRLSFEDLSHVFEGERHKAGIHQILDPEAIRILKEEAIKVVVVNGFDPENLLAAVQGKKVGTIIT